MAERIELVPAEELQPGDEIVDPRNGIRVTVKAVEPRTDVYVNVRYIPHQAQLGTLVQKRRLMSRYREVT